MNPRADSQLLENYTGHNRKAIREAVFSFDYSILKTFDPKSEMLKEDLRCFVHEDVPHLSDALDMASSMGFKGWEMHRLVASTLSSMKNNPAAEISSDLKPLDCEIDPCVTALF